MVAEIDVPTHASGACRRSVYQREAYFSNRSAICTAFRAAPFRS